MRLWLIIPRERAAFLHVCGPAEIQAISLFFHLILIFSLHCQLLLLISGYYTTCNIKITHQCKIIIVPEEGWFGQPKYSTHKKDPSTLCRLLLLFSSFYM